MKNPVSRKGTPRPTEYIAKRRPPATADSLVPARIKILARMGPKQGVQPTPKAAPTIAEFAMPVPPRPVGPEVLSLRLRAKSGIS